MLSSSDIPTLAELALQYGTITQNQFSKCKELLKREGLSKKTPSLEKILIREKMATGYQINLLCLIRDFMVLRHQGERFGKIAVDKGYATPEEIQNALAQQKREFQKSKIKRIIGDILIEAGVITPEQQELIAREQQRMEAAAQSMENEPPLPEKEKPGEHDRAPVLADYERQFLKLRSLDIRFAEQAVTKKYASRSQADHALACQEREFKTHGEIQPVGKILVSLGVITPTQQASILAEQNRHAELEEMEAKESETTPEHDIEVLISQDRMEARIRLPEKNRDRISVEDLKKALQARDVRHGILSETMLQALMKNSGETFPGALGDQPVKGESADYLFSLSRNKNNRTEAVETIKKGEPLAVLKPLQPEQKRTNVLGSPASGPDQVPGFRLGAGARPSRDKKKAFAGRSGCPWLSVEKRLYVFSPVNILEDADLRSGPIEPFADLKVSGILTDVFPVKAGRLKAREIRGTQIEAIGDIHVAIGITNAVIRTQGNVYASYIHNSTIKAFGDVIVNHEILDSRIIISGACRAEKSRIIASRISAKQGVLAKGIGSPVTEPCVITAGGEDHIALESMHIDREIDQALEKLETLINEKETLKASGESLFKKMVNLKLFYDRAKKQRLRVEETLKNQEKEFDLNNKENTMHLLADLKKKMNTILNSLKDLNLKKKKIDTKIEKKELRLKQLRKKVEERVGELQQDRQAIFDWTAGHKGVPQVEVRGKIAQDTLIQGTFSAFTLDRDMTCVTFIERQTPGSPGQHEIHARSPAKMPNK